MAATAGLVAAPETILAGTSSRVLSLYSPHSQETYRAEYWRDGWYNPDVLARVNLMMRDWRTDEVTRIDPKLLDILYALQRQTGGRSPLHVICGYRSPSTNARLAATHRGVARNSYHISGQACDIRLPGYNLRALRDHALALEAGGVGYYPRSDFIHVDTGPLREW